MKRPIKELIEHDRRLVFAAPDESVRVAARRMAEEVCGSILVMDGERIAGIFTERDLLKRVVAQGRDPDATPLRAVMTRDPDTIEGNEPIEHAVRRMDEFGYRYLPVVEDGRVLGVVSVRHLPFGKLVEMQRELEQRHDITERLW